MVAALFICVWIEPEVMMDLRKITRIFRTKNGIVRAILLTGFEVWFLIILVVVCCGSIDCHSALDAESRSADNSGFLLSQE